jgi:hypothetical protein
MNCLELLHRCMMYVDVRNLRVTARRKVGKRELRDIIVGITLPTSTLYTSIYPLPQGHQYHHGMNMTWLYEPG